MRNSGEPMSPNRRRIYLDYNATHPLLAGARTALVDALDLVGNPSSVHTEGRRARATVEAARASIAKLVAASPENVVFTAGATEAAAACLTQRWIRHGREITIAALAVVDTDHPCTREGGQFAPEAMTRLPVDRNGLLDTSALQEWADGLGMRVGMLALCLANGETGVIQPLDDIRAAISGRDVVLVVDAVQAAGRLPLDIGTLGADAVLLSGHKIGAAKGVGAFVLNDAGMRPFRLFPGGGQESGMRSGTEAVPAIASFGAAARQAAERAAAGFTRIAAFRDRIVDRLRSEGCQFVVIGGDAPRLPNTLAIVVPGLKAETAQIALDLEGFAVSAGSACSSGKVGASHVLSAMVGAGLDVDPVLGLLRISLGDDSTEAEVTDFSDRFARIVRRVQRDLAAREAA